MTLEQIELAIDLSLTLSYRRTAEKHFISQPSLTYRVKALEAEVGVPLFRRSKSGVCLTPAGDVFCRNMLRVLEQTREILTDVRNCGTSYSDMLRVGLNGHHHRAAFVEIARRFTAEHPQVFLQLDDMPGRDRLNQFLRHELDAVFYMSEALPETGEIEHTILMRSGIYAVMRKDHPLAGRERLDFEDLRDAFILLCQSRGPEALLDAQAQLVRRVPVRSQLCASVENATMWIEARNGIALMPGFCHDSNERFSWVPLSFEETIPCSLAWHTTSMSPYLKDFIELATETFQQVHPY